MTRPTQLASRKPLVSEEISAASYEGSPEHKAERWWNGLPAGFVGADRQARRPKRQLTTICPLVTQDDRLMAGGWVRLALEGRQFRFYEGDKIYPKHLWY